MAASPEPLRRASAGAGLLAARFARLTSYLKAYRQLWEPRPFTLPQLPWEDAYPEVSTWLRGLSPAQADHIEATLALPPDAADSLRSWAAESARLSALDPLPVQEVPASPELLKQHLNDRKRAQLLAFCGAVLPWLPDGLRGVVEWCAGKGHLGRLVASHTGLPVVSLEKAAGLCATGNELAVAAGVHQHLAVTDVLSPPAWEHLQAGTVVLALHACGILTSTLVREALRRGVRALALAPCCHHYLNRTERYAPLSQAGRTADLPLTSQDLRLAILDEVVASDSTRSGRRREEAFRLGFDLLVRQASGRDAYESPGHLPGALFRLPFGQFCQEVAALRELPLPAHWDAAAAEAAGWERVRATRALSTLRAQFRRPLEVWVELDRALYLQEAGYAVTLGTFCGRHVTPRNILILASRPE